ncbi:ferritin [Aurantibacter crassamenti]|uniref:ferritin n=1 Tax=Aurantibacter crassamenti TaxID=1837375 RepID=UPI00193A05DD|nr:ferritin [Aurantibacter crassamenti]MBM1106400.1 ferritin [Aurantibacter crassamenti]
MNKSIEKLLNDQVKYEAGASMHYLAMASWADANGYNGIAEFFYNQSEEERVHMIKLVKFINERSGKVVVPALEQPTPEYKSLNELFEVFLKSEMFVTEQINHVIFECLDKKDYNVHNFMQWYVTEQLEEEAVARTLLDKLNIIGDDKSGHYMFDRDINTIVSSATAAE